jgi:hypothetical protein
MAHIYRAARGILKDAGLPHLDPYDMQPCHYQAAIGPQRLGPDVHGDRWARWRRHEAPVQQAAHGEEARRDGCDLIERRNQGGWEEVFPVIAGLEIACLAKAERPSGHAIEVAIHTGTTG